MSARARRLPAEEGLWVFVIADMTVLAIFFNVFAYYRRLEPAIFQAGQATLITFFGLVNTVILLTSSWFMVLALRAVRSRERRKVVTRIAMAVACGMAFSVLKIIEYAGKVAAGHTPLTNDFYMLYFMFTGLHFLHLVIGMIALVALIGLARKTEWNDAHVSYFESGAVYWHMVDLLWAVLFPLIYLIR